MENIFEDLLKNNIKKIYNEGNYNQEREMIKEGWQQWEQLK